MEPPQLCIRGQVPVQRCSTVPETPVHPAAASCCADQDAGQAAVHAEASLQAATSTEDEEEEERTPSGGDAEAEDMAPQEDECHSSVQDLRHQRAV